MATKKVRVRKLSIKRLIMLILVLFLICYFLYMLVTLPIKSIYIKGNELLSDNTIIQTAQIQDYPSILEVLTSNISKKLENLPLVKEAKIRFSLTGKLTISIDEYKILFYDANKQKLIVETGIQIDDDPSYPTYGTLINEVPDNIYNKLTKALLKVDSDVLALISEIQYSPSTSNEQVTDDTRFVLKMNDSNTVYANLLNIKNLNYYIDIFSTLADQRGYLYLDSSNEENFYFKKYD